MSITRCLAEKEPVPQNMDQSATTRFPLTQFWAQLDKSLNRKFDRPPRRASGAKKSFRLDRLYDSRFRRGPTVKIQRRN